MAAVPPVPRPTWTRRVPGWAFLVFFLSLIVLTYLAVDAWNRGNLVLAGYLAALASVAPILLVVVIYYLRPVWAMPVPLGAEEVARALAHATAGRSVHPLAEREAPFANCVSVVRLDEPACTIGWFIHAAPPKSVATRERVTVVLRSEPRDRKALAAFRQALADSLAEPVRPGN